MAAVSTPNSDLLLPSLPPDCVVSDIQRNLRRKMHLIATIEKRSGAVFEPPSGSVSFAGLVAGSSGAAHNTVAPGVDGQFDDAPEALQEGTASSLSQSIVQSSLRNATVPMAFVVTPPPQHQMPHLAVPTMSMIHQPLTHTIVGTPAVESEQRTIPISSNMIQVVNPFPGIAPFSHAASIGSYIPIVPRPVKPPVWRRLPVSKSTKSTATIKRAVPIRRRVSSCAKGRERSGITSYGTKLLASLHPNCTEKISAFCRILPEHPSDILIPRTDVYPGQRLPMLKYMEPDVQHPIVAPFRQEDVLLGRGALSNRQCGNLWFRALVASYREAYHALPKGGKGQLARNLCNYVRLSGGRFLEQHGKDRAASLWYECGDARAQAKCSQALRETSLLAITDCEETSLSTGASADGSCDSLE